MSPGPLCTCGHCAGRTGLCGEQGGAAGRGALPLLFGGVCQAALQLLAPQTSHLVFLRITQHHPPLLSALPALAASLLLAPSEVLQGGSSPGPQRAPPAQPSPPASPLLGHAAQRCLHAAFPGSRSKPTPRLCAEQWHLQVQLRRTAKTYLFWQIRCAQLEKNR